MGVSVSSSNPHPSRMYRVQSSRPTAADMMTRCSAVKPDKFSTLGSSPAFSNSCSVRLVAYLLVSHPGTAGEIERYRDAERGAGLLLGGAVQGRAALVIQLVQHLRVLLGVEQQLRIVVVAGGVVDVCDRRGQVRSHPYTA